MGKLRTGPATTLIKNSKGAETSKRCFYISSYSSSFGQENFVPRPPKPKGTGYLANFRPGLNYSPSLDRLDNPAIGKLLEENYETCYAKQHRPYFCGSDGTAPLPERTIATESGFTQQKPITTSDMKNVYRSRLETLDGRRHRTLLHRLKNKRVDHLDKGSLQLVTETDQCYLGKPSERMSTHLKNVGRMEPSGFTHYHHFDPIQYLDRSPYANDSINWRPMGVSHNDVVYPRWPNMSGSELNAGVCSRAQRDNGYSYETTYPRFVGERHDTTYTTLPDVPKPVANRIRKNDPCEFVNMTHGADHTTLSSAIFRGEQPRQNNKEFSKIGKKESTGYSANNDRYVTSIDYPYRFITHYNVKHGGHDKVNQGLCYSNQPKETNGFTKSTLVHKFAAVK